MTATDLSSGMLSALTAITGNPGVKIQPCMIADTSMPVDSDSACQRSEPSVLL